jgi:uncharacterized repeat protein (TIGR02543 family)
MDGFFKYPARFGRIAVSIIAGALILALAACPNPTGNEQHTITFDSQDGSPVAAVSADPGAAIPKPADPAKEGYAFWGWFDAVTGGTAYEWPYTLNGDVTMYAQWALSILVPGGETKVGQTLTADTESLEGTGTISYQWQRGDSSEGDFENIADATGETYVITEEDQGKYIRVTVSRGEHKRISGAAGPVDFTLSINISFNYGDITITGNDGANIIYKTGSTPNSVQLSADGYTEVKWYVDGNDDPVGTEDTITLAASDYSAKLHHISFMGKKDGRLYSQVIPFTVRN